MVIFKNQSDGSSNLGKEIISKRAAICPFYWYTKIANIFLFEAKVVNISHTLTKLALTNVSIELFAHFN